MKRISNPLTGRFEDHMRLLAVLCECYDQGNDIIALSISTAIRVLVHHTQKSTSLLAHLGTNNAQFLSTNVRDPRQIVHLGLVRRINVGVTGWGGRRGKVLAAV